MTMGCREKNQININPSGDAADVSSISLISEDFDWVRAETRVDGALPLIAPPSGKSDQNPAFSPNGATLVFTRWENGYNQGPSGIYLLDIRSGSITPLSVTDDNDTVNMPGSTWNAQSGLITFASDRSDYEEVWVISPEGEGLRQITSHSSREHWIEPTWSPNGEWIVYEVNHALDGENIPSSLWIVRADGSETRLLIDDPDFDARQPNWSPVNDLIMFQGREPGSEQWDLYTVRMDGSELKQFTDGSFAATDASWSPDGEWVVASTTYGKLEIPSLYILPIDGGEPVRVTFDDSRYDGAPSWSPDGMWLTFESYIGEEDAPSELWIIPVPEFLGMGPSRRMI